MPMTWLSLFSSGPPESPGSSATFVSINPVSRSLLLWPSLTVIDLPRPVTVPEAGVSVPLPPALPSALTAWPVVTFDESLSETVLRLEALLSWITATSADTS